MKNISEKLKNIQKFLTTKKINQKASIVVTKKIICTSADGTKGKCPAIKYDLDNKLLLYNHSSNCHKGGKYKNCFATINKGLKQIKECKTVRCHKDSAYLLMKDYITYEQMLKNYRKRKINIKSN